MRTTVILLSVFSLALFSPTLVLGQCATLYDDFSGTDLNATKWELWEGGETAEYGINLTEQAFHTVISSQGDAGTILRMKRLINPGEVVEYDLNYVSGSGNNIHHSGVNDPNCQGSWGDCHGAWGDMMEPQCLNCYIGFWNFAGRGGTDFGNYKIRMEFSDTMFLSVKKPDGSYWNETLSLSGLGPPYQLDFAVETGHNGLTHMDLDNFVIIAPGPCPEPACNCSELQQRIDSLEGNMTELKGRVGALEASLSTIQDSISLLQQGMDAFRKLVLGYLSNAPDAAKKTMICGYMKDNSLTKYSALGLSCEIKGWPKGKPFIDWQYCKCK